MHPSAKCTQEGEIFRINLNTIITNNCQVSHDPLREFSTYNKFHYNITVSLKAWTFILTIAPSLSHHRPISHREFHWSASLEHNSEKGKSRSDSK